MRRLPIVELAGIGENRPQFSRNRTMAYGRNKMLLGGELVSPSTLHSVMRDPDDEHRELQVLRCTNAHLMRELAELRTREAEAQRLADRDGLTGLYNRRRMPE